MTWKIINPQKCLYLISAIVLLSGLSSAIVVYWTAEQDVNSLSGYEVIGGYIYPTTPENTKKYTHDLQLYGGTAAVLADELRRWFIGLWRGKSLAVTIACIASIISFGIFLFAKYASFSPQSHSPNESQGDKTG